MFVSPPSCIVRSLSQVSYNSAACCTCTHKINLENSTTEIAEPTLPPFAAAALLVPTRPAGLFSGAGRARRLAANLKTRNRCDDLESLGYVIVSMLKEGSTALPWSGSTSVASGLAAKKSTTLEALCRDCPPGMLRYMKAVRGMAYEDVPKYDELDAMLKSMLSGAGAGGGRGGASAGAKPKAASARGASAAAAAGKPAKGPAKRKAATEAIAQEEEEGAEARGGGGGAKAKKKRAAAKKGQGTSASSPAPASPKQSATKPAAAAAAARRSRRLSSPKGEEEFFDALQEHDGDTEVEDDEEPEVTKVVRGATTKRRGGGSAAAASATATTTKGRAAAGKKSASSSKARTAAKSKGVGVFVAEVRVMRVGVQERGCARCCGRGFATRYTFEL